MNKKALIIIFVLVLQIIITGQAYSKRRLIIDNVHLSRKVFNLSGDKDVIINFRLSENASVELKIYNDINEEVFSKRNNFKKGKNAITWSGLNKGGEKVYNGAYVYILRASGVGNNFTFNPASRTAGLDLELKTFFINSKMDQIEYTLPKAAWVRLRIGIKDGPLFDTLLDWIPKPAGRNILSWDGWTKDKILNIAKDPSKFLSIQAISLPSNSIIVEGGKTKNKYKNLEIIEQGKLNFTYPVPLRTELFIPEPAVEIEFPGEVKINDEGEIIILDNKLKLRINLREEDRERLTSARFEMMFFVDNVFLYEDEQAYTPYNYDLDLSGLSKGLHIVNVNILGYNKTVGAKNIKIRIE